MTHRRAQLHVDTFDVLFVPETLQYLTPQLFNLIRHLVDLAVRRAGIQRINRRDLITFKYRLQRNRHTTAGNPADNGDSNKQTHGDH